MNLKSERSNKIFNKLYSSYSKNINKWYPISEIEPLIYLGGIIDPKSDGNKRILDSRKTPHNFVNLFDIDYIISVFDYDISWNLNDNIKHYQIKINDNETEDIIKYFNKVSDLIYRNKKLGKILFIHCQMGISRSSTMLAAYYLRFGLPTNKKPSLEEVLNFLKSKRSFICPNKGFLKQLLKYEEKLHPQ